MSQLVTALVPSGKCLGKRGQDEEEATYAICVSLARKMGCYISESIEADAVDRCSVGKGDAVSWQDGRKSCCYSWKNSRTRGRLRVRAETGHAIPPEQEDGQPAENHRDGRENTNIKTLAAGDKFIWTYEADEAVAVSVRII